LPLRPDEGLVARSALAFSRGTVTPDWGGDLTSGLTALAFRLFGDSDVAARLVPALLGVVAVACLALYRPLIGRGAALIGAALVSLSPVAVVGARSLGPEAAAFPLALALPPLAWSVFLAGRRSYLPLLALVAGLGLGSGALVPGVLIALLLWLAVEFGWLDGRAATGERTPWRRDRRLVLLAALALLPGVLLAAARYGAGFDRLTLAAIEAWAIPSEVIAPRQPWRWVPLVLLAYEPLVTALGLAGAVLVFRRWAAPDAAGGRLLLLWAGAALVLNLLWLRHDPAQLLLSVAPLALLAGVATVAATRALRAGGAGRLGLALLPLVPALGYSLVMLVGWANFRQIPAGEAVSVGFVLLGGVIATAALLRLLHASSAAALLILAWATLGGLTLHATANAAFNRGSEFLLGRRTLPTMDAIVRDVDRVTEPGDAVAVERRVRAALAWPLRDHPVTGFVVAPPFHPAVVPSATVTAADPSAPPAVPVTEQWLPSEWDAIGILRWWVLRTPWGPIAVQTAEVVP
jgi:4-amino-4-deoxy-L-arabinose transferase-like glycosyltransferase